MMSTEEPNDSLTENGGSPPLDYVDSADNLINDLSMSLSRVTQRETLKALRADLIVAERRVLQIKQAIVALEALLAPGEKESTKGLAAFTYPQAAQAVLAKANAPMRITDLLKRMERGGRPVSTTAPYRTLYRVLRDHPETFSNKNGSWSLIRRSDHIEWPDDDGELPPQGDPRDDE